MKTLRFIFRYVLFIKKSFFVSIVLAALLSVAFVLAIGMQKQLIDDVLLLKQYDQFPRVIALIAVFYIGYALLFAISPQTNNLSAAKLRNVLCRDAMQSLYRLPIREFNKERTGALVNYMTHDVFQISNMIGSSIPRIVEHTTILVTTFLLIGDKSPLFLGIVIFFCIIYILIGKHYAEKIKPLSKNVHDERAKVLVCLEEGVSSTREVLAYNRLQWERNRYVQAFQKYADAVLRETKLLNKQLISSEPIKWLSTLFILAIGGTMVIRNQMSIGTFVVLYQFSNITLQSFQQIYNLISDVIRDSASIERLRVLLDGPKIREGHLHLKDKIHTIELIDVGFEYKEGEPKVLNNINLRMEKGKKIAIVGKSGGGKSTLVQLLLRFLEPTTGKIVINGHMQLQDIVRNDWVRRVAVVFQDPYFFPGTIKSNILLGNQSSSMEKIKEACETSVIAHFVEKLPNQYDTAIGDRGITLSGGERQRLAIARALVREPEVLILDEATSALDLETERVLQSRLDEVRKNAITVVVAHRLSTVQNADVIYVLDQGKIAEAGTHEELMQRNGIYKQFVHAQLQESAE